MVEFSSPQVWFQFVFFSISKTIIVENYRRNLSKTLKSSSDALDALAEHIEKNCCWGKGPMEKMKVKSVEPSTAYKYLMNRLVHQSIFDSGIIDL